MTLLLLYVLAATPQSPAQGQPGETRIDASRGGLTVSSGVNSLTLGARLQVRWTLDRREASDTDAAGLGVDREDGAFSQFDVPRLRVTLSGGAFRPWLRYLLQFELSRTGGEGGSRVKDAVIEIRPSGANHRLLAGQFKAPFGLQQLTSSGRLQFVDRAITDAKFTPSRDMGVMFGGSAMSRLIGYEVGVFNGAGESVRQNNASHLWVGRVFVNPSGPYAVSESAVDAPSTPIWHIGAGLRGGKQVRGRGGAAVVEKADNEMAANLEFAFKAARFSSTAEYFWMTSEQENPAAGRDIEARGFHAQGGYMLVPRTIEVGLLAAAVDGDTAVEDSNVDELRGVLGYYWHGHNLKVQADVGRIGYGANFAAMPSRARQGLPAPGKRLTGGRPLHDTQVRVQVQLAF